MDNISIIDAGLISVFGVTTVFLILLLISVVVRIASKVLTAMEKKTKAPEPVQATPVAAASKPLVSGGNVNLINVDEKTAACIMAIVSHETKIELNQLVFKQIKGLD